MTQCIANPKPTRSRVPTCRSRGATCPTNDRGTAALDNTATAFFCDPNATCRTPHGRREEPTRGERIDALDIIAMLSEQESGLIIRYDHHATGRTSEVPEVGETRVAPFQPAWHTEAVHAAGINAPTEQWNRLAT